MPTSVNLGVVDVGAVRGFDARSIPPEAFADTGVMDAALRVCLGRPAAQTYVWVLPSGFERWLPVLEPPAISLIFSRMTDPMRGVRPRSVSPAPGFVPQPGARTLARVVGWKPDPTSVAFAAQCGLHLVGEVPVVLDGSAARDLVSFMDEARDRNASG